MPSNGLYMEPPWIPLPHITILLIALGYFLTLDDIPLPLPPLACHAPPNLSSCPPVTEASNLMLPQETVISPPAPFFFMLQYKTSCLYKLFYMAEIEFS
jgi:hypothetical protein